MLSNLIAFRLAAVYWGTQGFGEYVLARRTIGMLQLPILAGLGLAITRYVARSVVSNSAAERAYLVAAAVIVCANITLAVLILNVPGNFMAALLLGSPTRIPLLHALSIAAVALVVHGLAYGMHRGKFNMVAANTLQAVNLALMPLIAFGIPGLSVAQFIATVGILWAIVATTSIARQLYATRHELLEAAHLRVAARELLVYGLPRLPGEFAVGALLALPLTMAAHRGTLTDAGFIGLGISIVSMIGSVFAPFGQILLPAVSAMAARGDRAALRKDSLRLLAICMSTAVVLVGFIELATPFVVTHYLGATFAGAIGTVRLVTLGALPYVAYVVLRNILDGLHTRPLNTKNMAIALALFVVITRFSNSSDIISIAFDAALACLGVLTVVDAMRALRHAGPAAL